LGDEEGAHLGTVNFSLEEFEHNIEEPH